MAITQYYVDYGAGNDTTGDGTVGTPWKTIQKALDTITRNATDGDQINVKAGTAQVLGAALDLTTYGTPTAAGPLTLRGYTSAANDGGVGEIDCGGYTMWAATTYDYILMVDLDLHTFGDNHCCNLSDHILWLRCRVHKGASSPSGKYAFWINAGYSSVLGCHVYDMGTNGSGIYAGQAYCRFEGNYIVTSGTGSGIYNATALGAHIAGNIVVRSNAAGTGITCDGWGTVVGNAIYNSAAGTGSSINLVSAHYARNNLCVGQSGAGGEGINANNTTLLGYNAFYNCTSNYTISDQTFVDETANDVTLAASPFTDAANGDFSLTDAAKAALRSLGWPSSYLGAHANTDAHITIGPLQYGPTPAAAGGGFPILGGSVVR